MSAHAAEFAAEFAAQARRVIDGLLYLTLATADEDGRPWATPVFFGHRDHRVFYWASSPLARHSRNVAVRPDVGLVVHDSTVPIGGAEAVYVEARVSLVPDGDLDEAMRSYQARLPADRRTAPESLSEDDLVLYQAVAVEHSVLVRGGDPRSETGIDGRVVVDLGAG